MSDALKQRLDRIEGKAVLLARKQAEMRESRKADQTHIATLEELVDRQKKEIQQLTAKVQYLQLSHTVAPTPEDVDRSRDILAELVREIDRCIADIGN